MSAIDKKFKVVGGGKFRKLADASHHFGRLGEEIELKYDRIGYGEFANVEVGLHLPSGSKVAIKTAKVSLGEGGLAETNRELQALSLLRHPNICALYEALIDRNGYYAILEYIDGDTICDPTYSKTPQPEHVGQNLINDIGDALNYMHGKGAVHRDLHPGNIMFVKSTKLYKLIDFGHCCMIDDTTIPASRSFSAKKAPERSFFGKPMGAASEVFAFGRLLYKFLTDGREPFEESDQKPRQRFLMEQPPRRTAAFNKLSPECQDFLDLCLKFHVADRITTFKMFYHPFMGPTRARGLKRASIHPDFHHWSSAVVRETDIAEATKRLLNWSPGAGLLKNMSEEMKSKQPGYSYTTYNICKHERIKNYIKR